MGGCGAQRIRMNRVCGRRYDECITSHIWRMKVLTINFKSQGAVTYTAVRIACLPRMKREKQRLDKFVIEIENSVCMRKP